MEGRGEEWVCAGRNFGGSCDTRYKVPQMNHTPGAAIRTPSQDSGSQKRNETRKRGGEH